MIDGSRGGLRPRQATVAIALAFCTTFAVASPRITGVESPDQAQQDATVLFMAEGLTDPVRVFFSDGVDPTVEATPVDADLDRGLVLVEVPAGAQSGFAKITAGGVDSNPYMFQVDAGAFDRGSRVVSGQVTSGGSPVEDAAVVLLQFGVCDDDVIWHHDVTDASGNYSMNGQDGDHVVFVFPPASSGFTVSGAPATLGPAPADVDIELFAGVLVTGRVVRADNGAPVVNTRLEVDSDDLFDTHLTDGSGNVSIPLPPGDYWVYVMPSPTETLASGSEMELTVGLVSPQPMPDIELEGGVRIHGFVRRASDLAPLPNVEVRASVSQTCCEAVDEKGSGGDGSFTLVVPPNDTYSVMAHVEDTDPYVDFQIWELVVGVGDVAQNVDLEDAAFITGTVADSASGLPIAELTVQAAEYPFGGGSVAWTDTCMDGSYRLRVTPGGAGYVVSAANGEDTGHVSVTWDATPQGTFYPCEGQAVVVPTAGSQASGIDLAVPSDAAAVTGNFFTQASGCSALDVDWQWVTVDDGTDHGCGMGANDWMQSPGSYRIHGLPHSGQVSSLRVCASGDWDSSPQCWSMQVPPGYGPVVVGPYGAAGGIDFCLGSQPTQEIDELQVGKSGGAVTFSWTESGDLYHSQYRLHGAFSAHPASAPGTFPFDPWFDELWAGQDNFASLPDSTAQTYFLVTDVGASGTDGPSGKY